MPEIKVRIYCVKEGKCHREGLCIGKRDDGFVCPFLRLYCPERRFEDLNELEKRLKRCDS